VCGSAPAFHLDFQALLSHQITHATLAELGLTDSQSGVVRIELGA